MYVFQLTAPVLKNVLITYIHLEEYKVERRMFVYRKNILCCVQKTILRLGCLLIFKYLL